MKKNVLILCGGQSAEHEISLNTARNIMAALKPDLFNPMLVGISRSGTWYFFEDDKALEGKSSIEDETDSDSIATLMKFPSRSCLYTKKKEMVPIDIAFPTLHGPNGEDGTIQGLLELHSLPYIGNGVLSSALAMDKDVFKQVLTHHHILVTPSLTLFKGEESSLTFSDLEHKWGQSPFFVKPASMGSSVGVSRIVEASQLYPAIEKAFQYSSKVLIEKGIRGKEIECAVLGNLSPQASLLGEISPTHDFYSYEAKYLDPQGAQIHIPARLSESVAKNVQEIALKVFKIIGCRGLARVDFLVEESGEIYVNELNTFPGFTNISLYPKLWEESGFSYTDLITTLIELAVEEYHSKKTLFIR